jgi:hypothetical protein
MLPRNRDPAPIALAPPRTGWLLLLGAALLAGVLLRPRGVAVEVAAKPWQREVDIERQVQEMHSERCERMPVDARLQERRWADGVEHCRFLAPAWRKARTARAEGEVPTLPRWPALDLQPGERPGPRRALQELALRDEDGRHWSCRLREADWQAWPPGARTRLAVHRFTGVADCASLPPPPGR